MQNYNISDLVCTIYYDHSFTHNHNPEFGSMECGDRVNIDIDKYVNDKYRIVYPKHKKIYFDIMQKIHSDNKLVKYILKDPFSKTFFQKILDKTPHSKKIRNCHGCTMETNTVICSMCATQIDENKFFKFGYTLDNNVPVSDTTYVTQTTINAIKNSVSLVCQLIEDIYQKKTLNGFCIVRPPGHHACANISGGFCIVNNIAISAEYAIKSGFNKIFIFDFDAHHGNGTQEIFYNSSDVFYCSIHTIDSYPKTGLDNEIGSGDGTGYNLNILVDKGIGSNEYLEIFFSKVIPAIADFSPDLMLISAGFDGLGTDPMAIMKLSPDTYEKIISSLTKLGLPIGLILEGGYDLKELNHCYDICLKSLNIMN